MLSISGIPKNPTAFQGKVVVMQRSNEPQFEEINDSFEPNVKDEIEFNNKESEYTEEDYNSDKDFLEKAKAGVENVVSTVDTPKPVKTFMKVILGGISVAMGFMSMRWGTLASWKVAQDVITNPKAQKIVGGITKPIKDSYKFVSNAIKETGASKKLSGAISEKASQLGETKPVSAFNKFLGNVKETKLYKALNEKITKIKITTEKVKNFIANFFGVSGGVTAGVETIQASSRMNANNKPTPEAA